MKRFHITYEVAEKPSHLPIKKIRKNGEIEIIIQITQEQMNQAAVTNLKKKPK